MAREITFYIARDENGYAFLYRTKPRKGGCDWFDGDCITELPEDMSPEVTWADKEPT